MANTQEEIIKEITQNVTRALKDFDKDIENGTYEPEGLSVEIGQMQVDDKEFCLVVSLVPKHMIDDIDVCVDNGVQFNSEMGLA